MVILNSMTGKTGFADEGQRSCLSFGKKMRHALGTNGNK